MRFLFTLILNILIFVSLPVFAGDEIFLESAFNLHPTQLYVGMDVVENKARVIEKMTKSERREYLAENPVPVIRGPGGQYFMIDRHHLSLSLIVSGHHKLYVQVIGDWSRMSKKNFWKRMDRAGYAYLLDKNNRRINPSRLPESVMGLMDDPFRTLAYYARKSGAFFKSGVPFAEFFWAAFFRKHITEKELTEDFDASFRKAIEISKSAHAEDLPGYTTARVCRVFYHANQ